MPVDVKEDDQLGQKVTDIFSDLYINISKPDIDEDCHQLGKSNTVVRFINRNVCKDALKKKYEVKRLIDNSKLGFKREKTVHLCEFYSLQPVSCMDVEGVKESKKSFLSRLYL